MKPKISVVIPTYNEKEKVAKCIESLLSQSYPQDKIEIIVVDDGSTDGTSDFIKKNFPKVKLITKKNSGAYDSRNKGIAVASGEIIALTDGDCIATKNWLKNIEKVLRKKKIQVVGGKITHDNNKLLYKAMAISDFGGYLDNKEKFVTSIPTGNLAAKREIFEKFSFNSNLRSGGDRLFSWNLITAGYKLLYHPSIEVIHRPPLSKFIERKYRYGNSFVQIRKEVKTLPGAKFIRWGIFGLIFLASGRFLLDFWRMIKFRKPANIKLYEIIPLTIVLAFGRIIFLFGELNYFFKNLKK
ncbi:MAG: putative glycosyltransferase EpsJ [Parcubacteria group bacterium ADurb.Bin159]|nr:MAG: putative glycosyltransferase EpsJ [Parcubacteria group bacterium ADurb.Bin159]